MQNAGWNSIAKMSRTIKRRRELDDKVCDITRKIQQNMQYLMEEYYAEDKDARRIEILATFDKINELAKNSVESKRQNLHESAVSSSDDSIPMLDALDLIRVSPNNSTLQLNAPDVTHSNNTKANNNIGNTEKVVPTEPKRLKTRHSVEGKPKSLLKESALKNTCIVKIDLLSKEQIEKWMKVGQKKDTNKSAVSEDTHNKKTSDNRVVNLNLKKITKTNLKKKEKPKLHVFHNKVLAKKRGYYNDKKIRIRFFPQKKKTRKLNSLHEGVKSGFNLQRKRLKITAA